MPQWEYLSLYLDAEVTGREKELAALFPGEKFGAYTPRALVPQLNALGAQGWELISCFPYSVGSTADILTHRTSPTNNSTWTHAYLCVFKRPLEEH